MMFVRLAVVLTVKRNCPLVRWTILVSNAGVTTFTTPTIPKAAWLSTVQTYGYAPAVENLWEQLTGTRPMPQIRSEPVPVTVWLIRSVLVWVQITVSPSAMVMLLGLKKNEPKDTLFVAAKAPLAQARIRTETVTGRLKPCDLAFKSPRLKSGLFIFLVSGPVQVGAPAIKHPCVRGLASRFCSRRRARRRE